MLTQNASPILQTATLSLQEVHIALPTDPADLASVARHRSPIGLHTSLSSAEAKSIASKTKAQLRFSVFSSPDGVKVICLSAQVGATQLRVLLRAHEPATFMWLDSCISCERMLIHIHDVELGRSYAICGPLLIRDVSGLLGVIREPVPRSESQRALGTAWVTEHLSGPDGLASANGAPVERVVLCVHGATEIARLLPGLGLARTSVMPWLQ